MEIVSVLIDRNASEISIVTTDDTTKETIERTLTLEQAWKLVTDLNVAIQKLTAKPATNVHVNINTRHAYDQSAVEDAVKRGLAAASKHIKRRDRS